MTAANPTKGDIDAFAAILQMAAPPVVGHCSGARSPMLWGLASLGDGADPLTPIGEAAHHRVDVAALAMAMAWLCLREVLPGH